MSKAQAINRCAHVKEGGARCQARPLRDSSYCFFHDPDKAIDRAAARKAQGRKNRATVLPSQPADRRLDNIGDVTALVSEVIVYVLRGELDARSANTVGYLCTVLLNSIQVGELEVRMRCIEAAVRPGAVAGLLSREVGGDVA